MAVTAPTNAPTGSISGLISGLDTNSIISQMVSFAQRPIKILQSKEDGYNAQLAAWQSANTGLLGLKAKAEALSSPTAFQANAASVSDVNALAVTADSFAVPGSYAVTINRLAQSEQRQSQGYADTNSATVGTGTIVVGEGGNTKTLTIDSTNNTLGGLRDAINGAGVGVSASIIDLGSLNAHDYHLVLTGRDTGAANALTFNPTLAGGAAPTWTTLAAATDASITLGSGPTATTVTKSTNTIDNVYPGLSLHLLAADATKQITVTVSPDTAKIQQGIGDFVTQYNQVMGFINTQFTFDSKSGQTGTLFGDFTLQNIQQSLADSVLAVVPGLPAATSTLSAIGFGTDGTGQLTLDSSKLDAALQSDPASVMKLFAGSGQSSDQSVLYLGSTTATKATGVGAGYQVRVDQTALKSQVTAGAAQTSNLAADETLTLNGTAVQLSAGMTPQQVLDQINAVSGTTGVSAARTGADGTGNGGYLTLQSMVYGTSGHVRASSTVSNGGLSGSTNTSGIGNVQVTETSVAGQGGLGAGSAGRDVTGAFGVTAGGVTTWETATGAGQTLTGTTGNANTDGLKVQVTAATTGTHGQITLTKGIGASIDSQLAFLTSPSGAVTTAEDTLNAQIKDLQDEITTQNDLATQYENDLRAQFNQLEQSLGQMQNQSSYLSSQFAALNGTAAAAPKI